MRESDERARAVFHEAMAYVESPVAAKVQEVASNFLYDLQVLMNGLQGALDTIDRYREIILGMSDAELAGFANRLGAPHFPALNSFLSTYADGVAEAINQGLIIQINAADPALTQDPPQWENRESLFMLLNEQGRLIELVGGVYVVGPTPPPEPEE